MIAPSFLQGDSRKKTCKTEMGMSTVANSYNKLDQVQRESRLECRPVSLTAWSTVKSMQTSKAECAVIDLDHDLFLLAA